MSFTDHHHFYWWQMHRTKENDDDNLFWPKYGCIPLVFSIHIQKCSIHLFRILQSFSIFVCVYMISKVNVPNELHIHRKMNVHFVVHYYFSSIFFWVIFISHWSRNTYRERKRERETEGFLCLCFFMNFDLITNWIESNEVRKESDTPKGIFVCVSETRELGQKQLTLLLELLLLLSIVNVIVWWWFSFHFFSSSFSLSFWNRKNLFARISTWSVPTKNYDLCSMQHNFCMLYRYTLFCHCCIVIIFIFLSHNDMWFCEKKNYKFQHQSIMWMAFHYPNVFLFYFPNSQIFSILTISQLLLTNCISIPIDRWPDLYWKIPEQEKKWMISFLFYPYCDENESQPASQPASQPHRLARINFFRFSSLISWISNIEISFFLLHSSITENNLFSSSRWWWSCIWRMDIHTHISKVIELEIIIFFHISSIDTTPVCVCVCYENQSCINPNRESYDHFFHLFVWWLLGHMDQLIVFLSLCMSCLLVYRFNKLENWNNNKELEDESCCCCWWILHHY